MDVRAPQQDGTDYSDDELRLAMELLFYAYRDFTGPPDEILKELDFGRAHHRVIHFVGRNPGITVSELLSILRITKQSLARVLGQLIQEGVIRQDQGTEDRRQRLLSLTDKGRALEERVSRDQRAMIAKTFQKAGPEAVDGFRRVLRGMVADARDAEKVRMIAETAHILVVDDDHRLRDLLQKYLSENGLRVTGAEHAADARAKMASIAFDFLVLDLMMPGENGIEFAKSVRTGNYVSKDVPILMLTAMAETDDRISGLEAGADDYMVKPFEPKELLLRINSILRRIPREELPEIIEARLGPRLFDMAREELREGDRIIPLTSTEVNLLKVLAQRPGAIVSREELCRTLAPGSGERTVDVQVNRLRRKIEDDPRLPRYLQTVRGQGYILRPD